MFCISQSCFKVFATLCALCHKCWPMATYSNDFVCYCNNLINNWSLGNPVHFVILKFQCSLVCTSATLRYEGNKLTVSLGIHHQVLRLYQYYTKKLGDKQSSCGQMSYGTQLSVLLGENPANSIFISSSLYDNQAWRCTNEIILLS